MYLISIDFFCLGGLMISVFLFVYCVFFMVFLVKFGKNYMILFDKESVCCMDLNFLVVMI